MATNVIHNYGSGAQVYVGFAKQASQHAIAAAPVYYMPVEADQVNFTFDPGRQALELATGDLYKEFVQVELQAKGTGSLEFPVFPSTTVTQLLAWCGLGDQVAGGGGGINQSIQLPLPLTFFIGRVVGEEVYGGCVCKMITFTAQASKPMMCKLEFEFTERPTNTGVGTIVGTNDTSGIGTSALNLPTWPSTYTPFQVSGKAMIPFLWSGLQPVTFLSNVTYVGASDPGTCGGSPLQSPTATSVTDPSVCATTNMDTIEVSVSFELAAFYGNHGNNLPSALIPSGVSVAGKFSRLFTNIDEYLIFNEACAVTGTMVFSWQNICQSPTHTLTLTLPSAFYKKQSFKNPMKGPIVEDYDIGTVKVVSTALTTTGSPLVFSYS